MLDPFHGGSTFRVMCVHSAMGAMGLPFVWGGSTDQVWEENDNKKDDDIVPLRSMRWCKSLWWRRHDDGGNK